MTPTGLPQVVTLGGTALPLARRARVYACGITPYDVTHLGHAATFVWVDTLARVLHTDGTEVIVCRNVTDVDDVLLAAAGRSGSRFDEFAAIQQFYFDQDMTALGVRQPSVQPRAHAYIGQVIALATGLLARDAAYQRDGHVYFRGAAAAAGLDRPVALRLAAEYGDHPDDARKDDPFDVGGVAGIERGPAGMGEPTGTRPPRLAYRLPAPAYHHPSPGHSWPDDTRSGIPWPQGQDGGVVLAWQENSQLSDQRICGQGGQPGMGPALRRRRAGVDGRAEPVRCR